MNNVQVLRNSQCIVRTAQTQLCHMGVTVWALSARSAVQRLLRLCGVLPIPLHGRLWIGSGRDVRCHEPHNICAQSSPTKHQQGTSLCASQSLVHADHEDEVARPWPLRRVQGYQSAHEGRAWADLVTESGGSLPIDPSTHGGAGAWPRARMTAA